MDDGQDFQEQATPLGTPFDDSYKKTTSRGAPNADPPVGVKTGNYYTPLYTESQETCHTNVNTSHQPPKATRTYAEATRDAKLASTTVAAAAEAETSAEATAANAEPTRK